MNFKYIITTSQRNSDCGTRYKPRQSARWLLINNQHLPEDGKAEESDSGCRYKPTFSAKALGNGYAAWVSRQDICTTKSLTEGKA